VGKANVKLKTAEFLSDFNDAYEAIKLKTLHLIAFALYNRKRDNKNHFLGEGLTMTACRQKYTFFFSIIFLFTVTTGYAMIQNTSTNASPGYKTCARTIKKKLLNLVKKFETCKKTKSTETKIMMLKEIHSDIEKLICCMKSISKTDPHFSFIMNYLNLLRNQLNLQENLKIKSNIKININDDETNIIKENKNENNNSTNSIINNDFSNMLGKCTNITKSLEPSSNEKVSQVIQDLTKIPNLNSIWAPDDFSKVLEELRSHITNIEPLLQDPNLSPCCKKSIIAVSFMSGIILSCAAFLYASAHFVTAFYCGK
jgi:hypothetical protein